MDASISLIEALTHYIDHCILREQSPRTIEGKRTNLRLFVSWYIKEYGFYVEELSKHGLNEYIRYLHEYRDPQQNQLIIKATRRNKITAVRMFCRFLFQENLVSINLAEKIRIPAAEKCITQNILQPEEVSAVAYQTIMHGDRGIRDCAILAVFFSCGLRRNEITTLTLKSINHRNRLIHIRKAKGRKDRIVPVAESTLNLVKYYVDTIRPKFVTFESRDFLFIDNRGKQYRGGQISDMISKHKRRAGVSKRGASNLYRHTLATTLLDAGADLLTVQEILGHEDVSTTQVYTHIAVGKMSRDYQKYHPSVHHPNIHIPKSLPIDRD